MKNIDPELTDAGRLRRIAESIDAATSLGSGNRNCFDGMFLRSLAERLERSSPAEPRSGGAEVARCPACAGSGSIERGPAPEKQPNRMPVRAFLELGLLEELNRRALHPLGLALEVKVEADGSASFGALWDYRDDPEGIVFADATPRREDGVARWDALIELHRPARVALFGSIVQPIQTGGAPAIAPPHNRLLTADEWQAIVNERDATLGRLFRKLDAARDERAKLADRLAAAATTPSEPVEEIEDLDGLEKRLERAELTDAADLIGLVRVVASPLATPERVDELVEGIRKLESERESFADELADAEQEIAAAEHAADQAGCPARPALSARILAAVVALTRSRDANLARATDLDGALREVLDVIQNVPARTVGDFLLHSVHFVAEHAKALRKVLDGSGDSRSRRAAVANGDPLSAEDAHAAAPPAENRQA